jgi:hypothetical protein
LLRVDVLWPVTEDAGITNFISKFPNLPYPFIERGLFIERFGGGKTPILVDIYHPIHRLYQEHFRNNVNPDVSATIHTWHFGDPLADVFLCTLGGSPSREETGVDYVALMKKELKASETSIANCDDFPLGDGRQWSVSAFCRAFMECHYSVRNHWSHPGLYLGACPRNSHLMSKRQCENGGQLRKALAVDE